MTDNHTVRISTIKIENRITFKIKTGYYLKLATPETMKLPTSTKSKLSKISSKCAFSPSQYCLQCLTTIFESIVYIGSQ